MSERGSEADSFLSELDARLRAIQGDLRPGVAAPTLTVRSVNAAVSPAGNPSIAAGRPMAGVSTMDTDPPAADPPAADPPAAVEPPAPSRGRSGPLSALLGQRRAAPAPEAPEAPPEPAPAEEAQPSQAVPERSAVAETVELLEQVKSLTETQARLLRASERLLEAFARAVESPPEPASPPGLFAPTIAPPVREGLEISVGPFVDTEALREFERALEGLDAVRRVTIRGYEGSDRAIFDVELER